MKTVLITGASRGIGASLAKEFAKNKYNVVINYCNSQNEALKLAENLRAKYNVQLMCVKADISNEDEVKNMIDTIINKLGRIDVLINNAAISKDCYFDEKSVMDFKIVLDVNLVGTFLVSKHVGKYMLDRKCGKIINITSTNGIDTMNSYSIDYDASKAGVINLTHNLAKHYAPYINVNAIALGWVNTDSVLEMDPRIKEEEQKKILLNRFANPEEIAKIALFLASADASYINNSIIRVDGGIR